MIKTHEIEITKEQLEDINGSSMFVANSKEIKKDDYVLFKTQESTLLSKIELTFNEEGIQDGYTLLKVRKLD